MSGGPSIFWPAVCYVYLLQPTRQRPSVDLETFPACDTCACDLHVQFCGTRSACTGRACSGFSATNYAGTRLNLRRYVRVGFRSGAVEIGVSQFLTRTFPEIADTARLTPHLHCACMRVSPTSQPQTPQIPRVLGLQWLLYPMLQLRLPLRAHGRCASRFVRPSIISTSRVHGS